MAERVLYFDCFSGASGDMIVGALLDLGLDVNVLRSELAKLPLEGFSIKAEKVIKAGFSATKFNVIQPGDVRGHHGRNLHYIVQIIEASGLSTQVKHNSIRIFHRLAEAEAKIHGTVVEEIHFHEVGALDSIIDIVGASIGLETLKIDRVLCSPLPLGRGIVHCHHGLIPVPAPAAMELLIGMETYCSDHVGETVTPTGAAILSTLSGGSADLPVTQTAGVGYGAGTGDFKVPNLLRAVLGYKKEKSRLTALGSLGETIIELEANIDDLNPEIYDYVFQQLFDEGALDVMLLPIQMKKNRPGIQLRVLCREDRAEEMAALIFRETSTIGVRLDKKQRICLPREIFSVTTPYGEIRIKQAKYKGVVVNRAPEYDDCRERARVLGVPLKAVYEAAIKAAENFDNC